MTHARDAFIAIGAVAFLLSLASATPPSQVTVTDASIAGAWMGRTYHGVLTLKLLLRADHHLEWSVDSPQMVNTSPVLGTWRLQRGHLAVVWESRTDTVLIPIVSLARDKLIIDFPERRSIFHRVQSLITPMSSNHAMEPTADQRYAQISLFMNATRNSRGGSSLSR